MQGRPGGRADGEQIIFFFCLSKALVFRPLKENSAGSYSNTCYCRLMVLHQYSQLGWPTFFVLIQILLAPHFDASYLPSLPLTCQQKDDVCPCVELRLGSRQSSSVDRSGGAIPMKIPLQHLLLMSLTAPLFPLEPIFFYKL